jgi:hypothetical protein
MPDEFPMQDPKQIWQTQPTEQMRMSLEEIRRKARALQTKARLSALTQVVIGIALCIFFGWTCARARDVVPRIGWGVLSVWGIYGAFQAYRWVWPSSLATDAPLSTSLAFYRRELERQRDYERQIWVKSGLIFCFLGLAIVLVPPLIQASASPRRLVNAAPFFILLSVWFVVFFRMRKKTRAKLQGEIDELNALEAGNR